MQKNLYILTGTPGTGKTTLIEHLQTLGINCVEEPTRAVLDLQLKIDGPALPSKSPRLFIQAMLAKLESEFDQQAGRLAIFDRGIPDMIAYAIRFGVDPDEFKLASQKHRYNSKVFILPPWKEIFVNDPLRKLSYEDALKFHSTLVEVYQSENYDLIELPRCGVRERAEILLNHCSLK